MLGMWEWLMRKCTVTPHDALATGLPALGMLLEGIRFVCDYCRDHHQIPGFGRQTRRKQNVSSCNLAPERHLRHMVKLWSPLVSK